MSAPARFRKEDVKRAVRGAIEAGLCIARIEIDPTGKIAITFGEPGSLPSTNPLDRLLTDGS